MSRGTYPLRIKLDVTVVILGFKKELPYSIERNGDPILMPIECTDEAKHCSSAYMNWTNGSYQDSSCKLSS